MFHIKDISNIIRDVYTDDIVEEIDIEDIKTMLTQFSYESVKVVL